MGYVNRRLDDSLLFLGKSFYYSPIFVEFLNNILSSPVSFEQLKSFRLQNNSGSRKTKKLIHFPH